MRVVGYSRAYRGPLSANPGLLAFFALLIVFLMLVTVVAYFKYARALTLGERVKVSWVALDSGISTYAENLPSLASALSRHGGLVMGPVTEAYDNFYGSFAQIDRIPAARELLTRSDEMLKFAREVADATADEGLVLLVKDMEAMDKEIDVLVARYNRSLLRLDEHTSGRGGQMLLALSEVGHYRRFE